MKAAISILFLLLSTISYAKSNIEIKNATIKLNPPGSTNSIMFAEIINHGDIDKKVLKVTGPVSDDFEMHEMAMDNNQMTMRKVESIVLKRKSTTQLKTGGLHIMIFNLKRPLKEKEAVTIEFTLDANEKIQIKAIVSKS